MAKQQIDIIDCLYLKSIQQEDSPAYYTENAFMISNPTSGLEWLEKIGPSNIKHLAKLGIFVHGVYDREAPAQHPYLGLEIFNRLASGLPWGKLFHKLAAEAPSLREIYIFWDAEPTCGHYGGGADDEVVRALAAIQGLQKLEIDGYFVKEWPKYLQQQTGLTVWKPTGRPDWYYEISGNLRLVKSLSANLKE